MDVDSFRNLMNQFETILETFVGKDDREDLSDRIRIKLSSAYENILFESNEKFYVDIFKERSGCFIQVIQQTNFPNENIIEEEYFLKVVAGKIVELS